MRANPKFDDAIDDLVNPILARMAEESEADFAKRLTGLSGVTIMALKTMCKEQIAVEHDQERKANLLKLDLLLSQH